MEKQESKELIRHKLPLILQYDRNMRDWILQVTRKHYADKQ
jgi:septum formation topological specificity factor MinE